MTPFMQGFVKAAEEEKKIKRPVSSVAGAILGFGAGQILGSKAYGKGAPLFWSPLAGAAVGNRLGGLLNKKVEKAYNDSEG